MKKRILSFAVVISIMTSLFVAVPMTANAETYDIYTYIIENGEVTITDCDKSVSRKIKLPEMIENHPVAKIGEEAFAGCENLGIMILPKWLSSIGDRAFSGCSGLTDIDFPRNSVSIGNGAFSGCSGLTYIDIPTDVTSIGGYAFSNCSRLANISIPWGVTSIGDFTFSGCTNLTSVNLYDSITSIGKGAFAACSNLKDVYYTGTEEEWADIEMGDENECLTNATIHYNCPGPAPLLTYTIKGGKVTITNCDAPTDTIVIPSTIDGYPVTKIANHAFYPNCSQVTDITIPESVTELREDVFFGCISLKNLHVDEDNPVYSSIDGNLFNKDKTILIKYMKEKEEEYYKIPDGVTGIAEETFADCDNLKSITLPDSITSIGRQAFTGCLKLKDINFPEGLISIGREAFYYCKVITSITLPASLADIGDRAFRLCDSMIGIEVDKNNPNYSSQDGVLFNKDKTTLIQYPVGKSDEYYKIPDGVTGISNSAFESAGGLISVTLPDSVTSIGNSAFQSCSNLSEVNIPDGVTSIGDEMFHACWGLTNITIPDSVTSIGAAAFGRCGLTSITIPDSVTTIGNGAFYMCGNLEDVIIPESVTSIVGDTFRTCENLKSVTILGNITTIDLDAFAWCRNLTKITIPDSVTYIKNGAFDDCTSLTDVYYIGTEETWKDITIGDRNEYFKNATVHFVGAIGDADNDGEIGVKDVISIRRFITGSMSGVNKLAADVNKDGKVEVKDVILIRRFITGGYGVEL